MTASPRFLVAKYVRDPQRMEPRNVGVILWTVDRVGARFFGEDEDGIRAPSYVHSKNRTVYREWVLYWQKALSDTNVVRVPRTSPEFVDALKSRSRDNFILVDGGTFLSSIGQQDFPAALNELFEAFVCDEPR